MSALDIETMRISKQDRKDMYDCARENYELSSYVFVFSATVLTAIEAQSRLRVSLT